MDYGPTHNDSLSAQRDLHRERYSRSCKRTCKTSVILILVTKSPFD